MTLLVWLVAIDLPVGGRRCPSTLLLPAGSQVDMFSWLRGGAPANLWRSAAGGIGDETPDLPWSTVVTREQELRPGLEELGTRGYRDGRSCLGSRLRTCRDPFAVRAMLRAVARNLPASFFFSFQYEEHNA